LEWRAPQSGAGAVGHSTVTTTIDLYSHVTEAMQAEAAEKLDVAHQSAKRRRDSQA